MVQNLRISPGIIREVLDVFAPNMLSLLEADFWRNPRVLGSECARELARTLIAACCCVGSQHFGTGVETLGLVETLLGTGTFGLLVHQERAEKVENRLKKAGKSVQKGFAASLPIEWPEFDSSDQLKEALGEFNRVIPKIVPTAEEVIAARLDPERIGEFLLKKAGEHAACFSEASGTPLARRFFAESVEGILKHLLRDPEMQPEALRVLLVGLDEIKEDTKAIPGIVADMADDRARDELFQTTVMAALRQLNPETSDRVRKLAQIEAEIAKAMGDDPTLSGVDIVKQVVNIISSRAKALQDLAAIPAADNRVRSYQAAVEQALVSDDNSKALAALAQARAAIDERREQDARLSAKFCSIQADLLLGERKWQEADATWSEATAVLAPFDPDAAEKLSFEAAKSLFEYGDTFVERSPVIRALDRYDELLAPEIERNNDKRRGTIHLAAGVALMVLGSTEEDPIGERLRFQALDSFSNALKFLKKDSYPKEFAETMNELGSLYLLQSERYLENGERQGANELTNLAWKSFESVAGYFTEKDFPFEFASIHVPLGKILHVAGLLADTQEKGVELFSDAMKAFRKAESVLTETAHPMKWAQVQMMAGDTLMEASRWVEKELRAKLAFDAVAAHRAALRVYSEFETPNDWAQAKLSLGVALMSICKRSEGPDWDKLKSEANDAFSSALRVWNLKNFPYAYNAVCENMKKLESITENWE